MSHIHLVHPTVETLVAHTSEFKYKLQHIGQLYQQVAEVYVQNVTATPMILQSLWAARYWHERLPVLDTADICRLVTLYGIGSRSGVPEEYILQDIVTEMYLNGIKRKL